MKTILQLLALGFAGALCVSAARADVDVSVGVQVNATADFYEPLTPHGAWVEVGSYGRCWRPAHVAVGWRPYCDGHWEWTDCGWYWVSDEPWGWACYHYGTWTHDSFHGWVWVPGVEWAPAWVYWRVGGGHIGWAPCGPRGVVVAPSLFVFVENRRFHERLHPSTVIVNNTTIINNTKQITEIRRETRNIGGVQRKIVVNNGPGVDVVQKATVKRINPLPVTEVAQKTPVPAEFKRKANEAAAKEKRQPNVAPERKASPTPEPPPKSVLPDKPDSTVPQKPEKSPDKDKVVPPEKPDEARPPEKPDKGLEKPDKTGPLGKAQPPAREHTRPPNRLSSPGRPPTPPPNGGERGSGRDRNQGRDKGPGAGAI